MSEVEQPRTHRKRINPRLRCVTFDPRAGFPRTTPTEETLEQPHTLP